MSNVPQFLEKKFIEWQYQEGERKTLDDFAQYVGVSRPLLSMWMNGDKSPGPKNRKRLIELFGDEAFAALGIDPDFYVVQESWDDLTPEQRHRFSKQVTEQAQKNDPKRSHQKRTA